MIRRILIVRSAFGDLYEPAWCRSLRDLGYETEVFDTHELISKTVVGRIEERLLWGPHLLTARRVLINRIQERRPDVTLFYHGHHFDCSSIQAARRFTFVTGYHNDDPFGPQTQMLRYRLLKRALCAYDGYHVFRHCNIAEAQAYGARRVRMLMFYYLPWLHYPERLRASDQERFGSDVVFAGHMEPDSRLTCFSKLVRAGVKLRIFGRERFWKPALPPDVYLRLSPVVPAQGDAYRSVLCASKIGACFFSKRNRDEYTGRAFEVPACGLFLLSERTPTMQTLYREGQEAEFFSSPEEFVDKVAFYLHHESSRERIAQAGRRRAISSGYDIHSRMRQWVQDISEWMHS